jgi:hypothetical protein
MGIVHELDNSGFNANGMKQGKRSRPLLAHAELSFRLPSIHLLRKEV